MSWAQWWTKGNQDQVSKNRLWAPKAGYNGRILVVKYSPDHIRCETPDILLTLWFTVKIKEEGMQSQCVEANYAVLLQCNDRECHSAYSQPTPGRSEHISMYLVLPLVFYGKMQQNGFIDHEHGIDEHHRTWGQF